MTNKEKELFYSVLENAKLPYGCAANISRYVQTKERKIWGKPEASIAEGYLVEECLNLCSRFLGGESATSQSCRQKVEYPIGTRRNKDGKAVHLKDSQWLTCHRYILFNCGNKEVESLIEEHRALIDVAVVSDPSVKVVVRIRAVKSKEGLGDFSVRNISDDSILVEERKFKFDSVLNSNSKQEDVFELVGVPLVKNTLAGYNTSILAYGQTGSGKSYTMWGPPSAMLETNIANGQQGVAPRIFQMLFSEIQREQEISEDKQINYQCRCSFLEIYNEQIGDLLDPTQRNLKGLSSRKVGATSINSKSSRSHVVFTCIVESWCKNTTAKCFSSTKTSRITLATNSVVNHCKI
ncbi:hypothetical protein POM88_025262 [Heracleum sosnowskyi]|uniref:Kinesin motor domain-containing protein n=1 Tax=Heracleum sosnowskyi TaxID=360622 RepID=A0AAD8I4C2_9APIA|nr:hypothetical protein POM88_025262 [Heracleum sosnowskyi]